MNNIEQQIKQHLANYLDPYLAIPLEKTHTKIEVECADNKWKVKLDFPYPVKNIQAEIGQELKDQLQALTSQVGDVVITWQIHAHTIASNLSSVAEIKNIIAVASGKGGVGKSTTAVNLALALQQEGARVGILDADIYGPNQPQMLGVRDERPVTNELNKITPIERFGLQTMSIGYLIDANQPMIWRGPMVSGALQQLLNDTAWKSLDYLIIDLPPGTGDIQLTLSQKIPVTGAVIVTTPQEIALADARKGLAMFRKVKVPILGIVENMSYYTCDHCDEKSYLFGQGGGAKMAEQYDAPFLGEIPLMMKIREQADQGVPIVEKNPDSAIAKIYLNLARQVAARLSLQEKNYAARFPKIVIENN